MNTPKVHKRLGIDPELFVKLKEKGIDISFVCNEALLRAVKDPALIDKQVEEIDKEIDRLKRIQNKVEKPKEKEPMSSEAKLRRFLSLRPDVVENEIALKYWSEQLGKSVEELKALKRG